MTKTDAAEDDDKDDRKPAETLEPRFVQYNNVFQESMSYRAAVVVTVFASGLMMLTETPQRRIEEPHKQCQNNSFQVYNISQQHDYMANCRKEAESNISELFLKTCRY